MTATPPQPLGIVRATFPIVSLPGVIALGLVALLAGSILFSTLRLGISPMPSNAAATRAVLSLIAADQTGDIVELGAGWGTLAFALLEHAPRARIIAWEASPIPYLFIALRRVFQRDSRLLLRFGNFHDADLREASVVTAYLFTGGMTRLAPKLDAELPDGSCVITHTFSWRGRSPTDELQLDDLFRTRVYRYVIEKK